MALATESTGGGSTTPILRLGSRGEDVKALQTTLNAYGFNVGTADGIFGEKTASALKAFQTQAGLTADGLYGTQTASALYKYQPPKLSTANQSTRSATMMYNETQPVAAPAPAPAPASPQQLGAQAQAQSQQIDSQPLVRLTNENATGQMMMTPDQAVNLGATINNSGIADFKQADYANPYQQSVTMADFRQADAANAAVNDANSTGDMISNTTQPTVTPVDPLNTGGTTGGASLSVPTTQSANIPVIKVSGANAGASVGGAYTKTATPKQTVTATGGGEVAPDPEFAKSVAVGSSMQARYEELFNQLNTMTADWKPEEDAEYQHDAVDLENKVSQAMVARGGLYSSVARAAFQSGLADLELGYRKQAYDRFITNRNFVFQQLQFVAQRMDAEFDHAMTVKNYEFQVQKEAFSQKMQIAQFNADQAYKSAQLSLQRAAARASQATAAAQAELARVAREQQATYNQINSAGTALYADQKRMDAIFTKYKDKIPLSAQELAFLGLDANSGGSSLYVATALNNKQAYLDNTQSTLEAQAKAYGDAQLTANIYAKYIPKQVAEEQVTVSETMDILDKDGIKIGTRTITSKK